MNTTTVSPLTDIIPLPEGTLVVYQYETRRGLVTVCGRKGQPVNPGSNGGFRILDEAGEVVATITRYAQVRVL